MSKEVELRGHAKDDHGKLVEVTLNGETLKIVKGRYSLTELKNALGVEPHCDIDIIDDGVFRTVKSEDFTNIKEGMEFISRQCAGGAS